MEIIVQSDNTVSSNEQIRKDDFTKRLKAGMYSYSLLILIGKIPGHVFGLRRRRAFMLQIDRTG